MDQNQALWGGVAGWWGLQGHYPFYSPKTLGFHDRRKKYYKTGERCQKRTRCATFTHDRVGVAEVVFKISWGAVQKF